MSAISNSSLNTVLFEITKVTKLSSVNTKENALSSAQICINGKSYYITQVESEDIDVKVVELFFVELVKIIKEAKIEDFAPLCTTVEALRALKWIRPVYPINDLEYNPLNDLEYTPQEVSNLFSSATDNYREVDKMLKQHLLKIVNSTNVKTFRGFLETTPELQNTKLVNYQLADIWVQQQSNKIVARPQGFVWNATKNGKRIHLIGSIHTLPKQCSTRLPLGLSKEVWKKISVIALEYITTDPTIFNDADLLPRGECTNPMYGTESILLGQAHADAKNTLVSLETLEIHSEAVDLLSKVGHNVESLLQLWKLAKYYSRGDKVKMEKACVQVNESTPEPDRSLLSDYRNKKMAASIDAWGSNLETDQLLACVGTSHYFGRNNILDLLRWRGWEIFQ